MSPITRRRFLLASLVAAATGNLMLRPRPAKTAALEFERDIEIGDMRVVRWHEDAREAFDLMLAEGKRVAGHDRIVMTSLPPGRPDKSDPFGQHGYVGWKARDPVVGWRDRVRV